eukprot:3107863-Rhodomonas_salina.3
MSVRKVPRQECGTNRAAPTRVHASPSPTTAPFRSIGPSWSRSGKAQNALAILVNNASQIAPSRMRLGCKGYVQYLCP